MREGVKVGLVYERKRGRELVQIPNRNFISIKVLNQLKETILELSPELQLELDSYGIANICYDVEGEDL
jgi:hypothetical protein